MWRDSIGGKISFVVKCGVVGGGRYSGTMYSPPAEGRLRCRHASLLLSLLHFVEGVAILRKGLQQSYGFLATNE